MSVFNQFSFAKQLIFYLLIVLIATFVFISWTLTTSVRHFIGNNAYTQAQTFAKNIRITFEREMHKLESIPEKILNLSGCHSMDCISTLPALLMKNYPQLIGCSLHCNIFHPDSARHTHLIATREAEGKIKFYNPRHYIFHPPGKEQIIHQTKQGCWIYSRVRQEKTIAYCYSLYDNNNQFLGFLKLDFPQKQLLT